MRRIGITRHIALIHDGQYSNGDSDVAIIEDLILPAEFYGKISFGGLPDIRVIAFEGFPVMAMLRSPTRESKGKANLHMGAVAIGIKIADGRTFRATYHGKTIGHHPDTGAPLVGLEVPDWSKILEIACAAQQASRLGYAGVDIVVDQTWGPLVMEVNKRPGLAIQIANLDGLKGRLDFVEQRMPHPGPLSIEEKVRMAITWAKEDWEVGK